MQNYYKLVPRNKFVQRYWWGGRLLKILFKPLLIGVKKGAEYASKKIDNLLLSAKPVAQEGAEQAVTSAGSLAEQTAENVARSAAQQTAEQAATSATRQAASETAEQAAKKKNLWTWTKEHPFIAAPLYSAGIALSNGDVQDYIFPKVKHAAKWWFIGSDYDKKPKPPVKEEKESDTTEEDAELQKEYEEAKRSGNIQPKKLLMDQWQQK